MFARGRGSYCSLLFKYQILYRSLSVWGAWSVLTAQLSAQTEVESWSRLPGKLSSPSPRTRSSGSPPPTPWAPCCRWCPTAGGCWLPGGAPLPGLVSWGGGQVCTGSYHTAGTKLQATDQCYVGPHYKSLLSLPRSPDHKFRIIFLRLAADGSRHKIDDAGHLTWLCFLHCH